MIGKIPVGNGVTSGTEKLLQALPNMDGGSAVATKLAEAAEAAEASTSEKWQNVRKMATNGKRWEKNGLQKLREREVVVDLVS